MKKKDSEDIVFRYPLSSEEIEQPAPLYDDRLVELFRQQIINLLDVVDLTHQGEIVKIDGFAFLNESHKINNLFRS